MRLVLQRVSKAAVSVDGEVVASIDRGLLTLVGVEKGDDATVVRWCADKLAALRVFEDEEGRMNLAVKDVAGEVLAVSQFTLAAAIRKGRRPSFNGAAPPEAAAPLFDLFVGRLREETGLAVPTGRFGAQMEVALINDGPVTFVIEKRPVSSGSSADE